MMSFYIIGCLVSFSIITKRYKDNRYEVSEAMFLPVLVLLGWIYIAIYIIYTLYNKRK